MRSDVARLYERYIHDVFRLALSYLHSKQDAEDVCQTVFMGLMDKAVDVPQEKEKAYLLTCTANACKNHLRSFWRKRIVPLEGAVILSTDMDRDLWYAIGKLPPKSRAVIHLYYFEGYDHGQIAEILDISVSAVQTRASRARDMLRKELDPNA